jgi:hypothetical protein
MEPSPHVAIRRTRQGRSDFPGAHVTSVTVDPILRAKEGVGRPRCGLLSTKSMRRLLLCRTTLNYDCGRPVVSRSGERHTGDAVVRSVVGDPGSPQRRGGLRSRGRRRQVVGHNADHFGVSIDHRPSARDCGHDAVPRRTDHPAAYGGLWRAFLLPCGPSNDRSARRRLHFTGYYGRNWRNLTAPGRFSRPDSKRSRASEPVPVPRLQARPAGSAVETRSFGRIKCVRKFAAFYPAGGDNLRRGVRLSDSPEVSLWASLARRTRESPWSGD